MFCSAVCYCPDIVNGFSCTDYNGNIHMEKKSCADRVFRSAGSGGSYAAEAAGF